MALGLPLAIIQEPEGAAHFQNSHKGCCFADTHISPALLGRDEFTPAGSQLAASAREKRAKRSRASRWTMCFEHTHMCQASTQVFSCYSAGMVGDPAAGHPAQLCHMLRYLILDERR